MSVIQIRPFRLASQQAMEKTQVILNQDDIEEVELEETVDVEKNMTKKKTRTEAKASGKLKSTNIVPIVTQNSKQ